MKPNQPEKEDHQTDEYFRRHANDIPIVFDPAHWDSLAAALDAYTANGIIQQRSPLRFAKKWRLFPAVLVIFGLMWWTWPAALNNGSAINTQGSKAAGTDSRYSAASGGSTQPNLAPRNHRFLQKSTSTPLKMPKVADTLQGSVSKVAPADSVVFQQKTPLQAADSLKTTPLKKKKHLFW